MVGFILSIYKANVVYLNGLMSKLLILLIGIFLFVEQVNSQPWLNNVATKKKIDEKLSFYDIQNAFNSYWKGKTIAKGKGFKQFKRWEAFMLPRVYPGGYFISDIDWREYLKIKKRKLKNTLNSDWKPLGPITVPDNNSKPGGVGRVNCIAFHPTNSDIVYVGTPAGGFWKSINGGSSWLNASDDLGTLGVSDIAVNPDNPNIIYIATGDGDAGDTYSIGVLKSQNGGESWNSTGLTTEPSDNLIIRRLIINPQTATILIAATSQGIYRTINGGVSWTNVQTGHFKDLEFNPGNPNIVYAARYGSNSARFYKSTDGGASFNQVNTGVDITQTYRLELAVSGDSYSDVIYALYSEREQDGFHSLWKSNNAGDTWTKVYDALSGKNLLGWSSDGSDIGGQGWYDLSLAVSPYDDKNVFVGGINIWMSNNSGADWNLVTDWEGKTTSYVHADHHWLAFSPSGVLFNGNDGGVYKTNNSGTTWMDISDGLNILQIDRIGTSQYNSSIVITGNQDNGIMVYHSVDGSWKQFYEGDGADCFIDRDNSNLYVSHVNGSFLKSSDGGEEFVSIKPSGTGEGAWHTPFVLNPENNDILYAGFNDVWKSYDKGSNWSKISTNLSPDDFLTQLVVAPSNSSYIYASTGTKHWVTKNGGQSWSEIASADLPDLYLTYFAIADNNPDRVWASFSGFSSGQKVYYSDNGGDTWINISSGLPNVPVNCIVRERLSNDVLYLGTDIGVFYRNGSLNNWELFNNNLPNVVISELEIQYSDGLLRAGTRGRGLWETTIPISDTNAPYIVKAEIISKGKQIELTFNKAMEDPVGKEKEFVISNGSIITALSINLKKGTTNVYIISLSVSIEKGDIVTISYTDGSVVSAEGDKLAYFVNKGVENSLGVSYPNIEKSTEIKVYPNPNNGTFEIECDFKVTALSVKLINLNGQIVYNKIFKSSGELFKRSFSIPENIKGTYIFLIEGEKEKLQKTIIIK